MMICMPIAQRKNIDAQAFHLDSHLHLRLRQTDMILFFLLNELQHCVKQFQTDPIVPIDFQKPPGRNLMSCELQCNRPQNLF